MKNRYFFTSFVFILFFILGVSTSYSQKPAANRQLEIIPNESENFIVKDFMRINTRTNIPAALYVVNYKVNQDSPENMAKQYLLANSKKLHLKNDLSDLVYESTRRTPGGYHVHFQQTKDGFPVYNSTIVVTINNKDRVSFVVSGYKVEYGKHPGENYNPIPLVSEAAALQTAKSYLNVSGEVNFEKTQTIVYYNKGAFRLAQKVNIVPSQGLYGDWEVLVDARSGEIFRAEDKADYYWGGGKHDKVLVNGSGWVFDPDPITHARTTYGSNGFTDNNDADSDSLTAQLETKDLLDITFDGSVYKLIGPNAEITDFEAPFTGLHTNATPDFYFTRSDDNFEAVNVYYHIDRTMRYLNDSLGFNVHPFQYTGGVRFDPHGLSGDDNSHYLPSTGSIAYGDGGVDDAEDFSVIVHELGHGIHDWITNGQLSQVEGLSEGSCDYWAASYLRSTGYWTPSDPAYYWVFVWDGHNPFWPGRITNYTAHYPEGLTGQIHTDGQMWSSSCMSIYDEIGRYATDMDFWEGLSMTNSGSGQVDAAYAFIQADQSLFGGSHLSAITNVFANRGYIQANLTADFVADVTGGPAPLTVHFTDQSVSIQDSITAWEWDLDGDGVMDSNEKNPTWTYNTQGAYSITLKVFTASDSASVTKQNFITVNQGLFVWEGVANGQDYSGAWIRDYLQGLGYSVVYSSAANLPSSLLGYDAVYLSFGNYGSGSSNTVFSDEDAAVVTSYLQNGGKVYLEGGDALGFDQSSNTTLLNLFGISSASDGSANNITNLQGQSSAITDGMLFTSSNQINNTYIDKFTANSSGTLAFVESSYGNVGVQGSGSSGQKTFCFSYAISELADGTAPNTRADLMNKLIDYFEIPSVPVELTSFNAAINDGVVNLIWQTATETNNKSFEIQRSTNNKTFETLGSVGGAGTSTEKHNYSFKDNSPINGKNYYRLKQIDFDGSINLSKVVEVDYSAPLSYTLMQNYPNPFNPATQINFSLASDSKVNLKIFNLLGQQVAELVNGELKAGKHAINFNAVNISSGVYFYSLTAVGKDGSKFTSTKKMVIMK